MQPAVFLDRDGVINRDKGYVWRIEDFEFLPGVFDACRHLNQLGYALVIVTNQSGIGRGYFSFDDFAVLNNWMLQQFVANGVHISDVKNCPYHPTEGVGEFRIESVYRKPGPQMLLDAAVDHQLDLSASFIVGDKASDIQAGKNAGVQKCFLIHPQGTQAVLQAYGADAVYASLYDMVQTEFKVEGKAS
ncbi:MAG: HAD family hydrolase [Gammaproteobacteria bacterium]|nr:HAD family hydrolase [Gammaproteobacteria bacterium]